MHPTIEEAKKDFEKEIVKFFQELFPLSREEIEYKSWKELSVHLGALIVIQKQLQKPDLFNIPRKEIAEIWKEAIDKVIENFK